VWKSRKFVIIAVIVAVALVGAVAGVALAQANNGSSTTSQGTTFAARVAAILGIDQQKVQNAFDKAKRDMADEALNSRLDALVKSGKMTQQQADQYKSWWQSRPQGALPGVGQMGPFGGHRLGPRLPRLQPTPTAPAQ
jgi:hypothetical protein